MLTIILYDNDSLHHLILVKLGKYKNHNLTNMLNDYMLIKRAKSQVQVMQTTQNC